MTFAPSAAPRPSLLWLTRDFRFSDHPALLAAIAQGPVLAVFFVDKAVEAQGSASRWRLEQALRSFNQGWLKRTGMGLSILKGEADQLLPELVAQFGITEIHQSDWPEPKMRALQDRVSAALAQAPKQAQPQVQSLARLILHPGHLLIHPRMVRTGAGGVYRVYTPFAKALRALGPDRPAPDAPARFAAVAALPKALCPDALDLAPDLYRGRAVLKRHALPAGEAEAQARAEDFLSHAGHYSQDRDRPDLDATSGLSDYLALGEISPRSLWALAEARRRAAPDASEGISKFQAELMWREFAWHLMIDFPQLASRPWRAEWDAFPWQGPSPALTQWCRAETGVGLVDAGLREMRVTGRMHNRVRMVVASWLTKHLLSDWRLGLEHFADSLTDWDPAANAMNWQWVAGCGPDASPFFRIFNPETQAKQYDPKGAYRDYWLRGEGAAAYLASLPSDWTSDWATDWTQVWAGPSLAPTPAPPELLSQGRALALAAYEAFRKGPSSSQP